MFKFNFCDESLCENKENDSNIEIQQKPEVKWAESYEIYLKDVSSLQNTSVNKLQVGSLSLNFISPNEVIENLLTNEKSSNECDSVLEAEERHSDLVTGVYEGGLKIWECTYDLINFLEENNVDFLNTQVLDLGCGAGILGIFAHLKGAKTYFQDYNPEVIKHLTMENFRLNSSSNDEAKFYSGDWESFTNLIKSQRVDDGIFDFILTSETIYNPENYQKLHDTFEKLLKKTGIIYLAAKCYYFGVGGGVSQMEDLIKKNNIFNCSTCWNCSEGVKRSILKLTFKNYLRG